jgi:hypothetical protein
MDNLTDSAVAWIVDPLGDYTPGRGKEIVDWLDAWGKPFFPSGRYYMLKQHGDMIWAGYKFHIGLATEEDADEFITRWGGFKSPGSVANGSFVTEPANAWDQFGRG